MTLYFFTSLPYFQDCNFTLASPTPTIVPSTQLVLISCLRNEYRISPVSLVQHSNPSIILAHLISPLCLFMAAIPLQTTKQTFPWTILEFSHFAEKIFPLSRLLLSPGCPFPFLSLSKLCSFFKRQSRYSFVKPLHALVTPGWLSLTALIRYLFQDLVQFHFYRGL